MITDQETNFVYFSELLASRYPEFFKDLERILRRWRIKYGLLPYTNDIWCRDYMPIQIAKNSFVQFKYEPSYLMNSKKYKDTITNVDKVCQSIGIKPIITDIRLDGGNVIKAQDKVILTGRIFSENSQHSKRALVAKIKRLLNVKKIIIVPECPGDRFGHADGMIRYLGGVGKNEKWLVNDFLGEPVKFITQFIQAITKERLNFQLLTYNPFGNKGDDAKGLYINYLQVGRLVIYPLFGMKEDKFAQARFTTWFGSNAVGIHANEIAKEGGVLNCVSWNIRK